MSMRVRLGLALAAVFLLGVVTGAAAWNFARARSEIDVFDAARSGSRHGVFVWSLERKLDLDSAQKSRILEILAAYDKESEAVKPQPTPQMKALKDKMRADVRSVLTPAQAAEYDVLIAELDAVRGRAKGSATPASSSSAPASSAASSASAP